MLYTGLPEMEVWAAGQPALLAAGGCLSSSLLAPPASLHDEADALITAAPGRGTKVRRPSFSHQAACMQMSGTISQGQRNGRQPASMLVWLQLGERQPAAIAEPGAPLRVEGGQDWAAWRARDRGQVSSCTKFCAFADMM